MKTIVEHVWIDGYDGLRSKTRVMDGEINSLHDIPVWNFDGSSTNQATGEDSEVLIHPCALFNDPMRKAHHKLVLCETTTAKNEPLTNNHRRWAKSIFDMAPEKEPWFGLEQEYFLLNTVTNKPLGYDGAVKQGQYYCSAGAKNAFGRDIAAAHLEACVYAGIKISGINAEVAPGQWEYQIGPCLGIEQGDHLWMARFLLERVAEKYGVAVTIEPKPLDGDWNGSGCHANYSTKEMREGTNDKTGLDVINETIYKLSQNHLEHMKVYGKDNEKRLSGLHETSRYDEFSSDIANRGCSIRIGNNTFNEKKGYFEDRRPSSNCDPYLVSARLFKTTML
jgi:glutamine synthetase